MESTFFSDVKIGAMIDWVQCFQEKISKNRLALFNGLLFYLMYSWGIFEQNNDLHHI